MCNEEEKKDQNSKDEVTREEPTGEEQGTESEPTINDRNSVCSMEDSCSYGNVDIWTNCREDGTMVGNRLRLISEP